MAGKDAISKTKEEFNKYRRLLLLNLPPSTEGEIQEFLGSFSASKINISDSLDSAVVTLSNGDQLDEAVTKLNNKQFKDNIVKAKPGVSSHLLCVAHIPPTYTDFKFREFCKKYGPVEYCYVMRTASGLSKGYGLVEFSADAEQVERIQSEIDWQSLDGHILHADFVANSYQTWDGLQSRCLFLHNMPENFVDVSKLREIFGCVSNPVYCQIIIKDEKSLGFGIIEFRTADDAEKTWLKLKNEKIAGKDVVMTFCIPGKSAVFLNNRITDKYNNKEEKDNLSQEPVAMPVIAGNAIAISLTKQMPRLMGDFMLVLHELQEAYVSQMMSPENKPGLLGAAPSLPLSPKMNPNMQLGLMVMLAIHIQSVKSGQFTGVLAKQLNTLTMLCVNEKPGQKIPLLADSLIGQANVILLNLKQQLNQVPVSSDNGKPLAEPVSLDDKVRFIVKKFIANGRYLNLTLLSALGQILVNMKQLDTPSYGLGPRTPSILGPLPGPASQLLMNAQLGKPAPTQLGNTSSAMTPQPTPNVNNIESTLNSTINSTIMQAMGLNVGSGSSLGNVGTNLLNQISQGLMTQIGQNLLQQLTGSGKGQTSNKKSKGSTAAQSSLAGALAQNVNQAKGPMAAGVFNQNVWKNEDNRWGTGVYDAKGDMGATVDSSKGIMGNDSYGTYGAKGEAGTTGLAAGYGSYGYGANEYGRYTYDGQSDYYYQNDSSSYNQYAAGYGAGGTAANTGGGYGMNTGYENNQASGGGGNYQQDDQMIKAASSGLGQGTERYGGGGGMSGMGYGGGMGYGYESRDGQQEGYSSYNTAEGYAAGQGAGGLGKDGMGGSDLTGGGVASEQQWGGGMGAGQFGAGGVAGGGMGSGGMGAGQFGAGGVAGGGMGSGGMGAGQYGAGGMAGSGGMGTGQYGAGGMAGSGGGMGAGQFGAGGMAGSGMGTGEVGGGQYGVGGMGSGNMGVGGGNLGMGGGNMGVGGMGGGNMGASGMGNKGLGGGLVENTSGGVQGSDGYYGGSGRGMNDGYYDYGGRDVNERYMGSGGGFGSGVGGFGTGGGMGGSLSETSVGSTAGNMQGGFGMGRGLNDSAVGNIAGMGNNSREEISGVQGSRYTGGVPEMSGPAAGMNSRGSSSYFTRDEASPAGVQSRLMGMANLKRAYGQTSDPAADNSGYPNQYSEGQGYLDAYKRNRLY